MKYFLYGLLAFVILIIVIWFSGGKQKIQSMNHDRAMLKLRNAERILDANADGLIQKEELSNAKARLLLFDTNGDGELSEYELGGPGPEKGMLRTVAIVRTIDTNADCSFSAAELSELDINLQKLDFNNDGMLDRAEIKGIMQEASQ